MYITLWAIWSLENFDETNHILHLAPNSQYLWREDSSIILTVIWFGLTIKADWGWHRTHGQSLAARTWDLGEGWFAHLPSAEPTWLFLEMTWSYQLPSLCSEFMLFIVFNMLCLYSCEPFHFLNFPGALTVEWLSKLFSSVASYLGATAAACRVSLSDFWRGALWSSMSLHRGQFAAGWWTES